MGNFCDAASSARFLVLLSSEVLLLLAPLVLFSGEGQQEQIRTPQFDDEFGVAEMLVSLQDSQ